MKQTQIVMLILISLLNLGCPGTSMMPTIFPGERAVPDEGGQHLPVGTTATYEVNPPASGPHWSAPGVAPLPAGLYREADGVRPEQWVHNLEHGYIVYLYECDGGCTADFLNQLMSLFESMPPSMFGNRKLVIVPYTGLGPFMMAIAWDVQEDFDSLDTSGLTIFYQRHVDMGPESVP